MSKFVNYLARYQYKGREWNVMFRAESWEDARARLMEMGRGQVVGSHVKMFEVNTLSFAPVTLWVRFVTWWKNFTGAKS